MTILSYLRHLYFCKVRGSCCAEAYAFARIYTVQTIGLAQDVHRMAQIVDAVIQAPLVQLLPDPKPIERTSDSFVLLCEDDKDTN